MPKTDKPPNQFRQTFSNPTTTQKDNTMSLASDFTGGFQTSFGALSQMKRDKTSKEERAADRALREDLVLQRANDERAGRANNRQNEIQQNLRHIDLQRERAADPRELVSRARAEQTLADMKNPDPNARLQEDLARMRLEDERDTLNAKKTPGAPTAPTARIRQPFGPGGKGMAEFDVPADQVPSIVSNSPSQSYKSPHARRIAELDKTLAAEEAKIASGDERAGMFTKRADTVQNASRERLRLLALELEDKVRAGLISQEEADEQADRLMAGASK